MTNKSVALALRAKILGTLLRDARKTKGASVEACAQAMGISPSDYQLYESGMNAPSMPELEGFAYFLDIPLDHFFSNQVLENSKRPISDIVRLKQIRQRIIGTMLRQTRQEMGISIDQLSEQTGLEIEKLNRIETGQIPVPMPELETICEVLNQPVLEYTDKQGPIGLWNLRQKAHKQFFELPENLQSFVSKPVNRPYLELAIRLSQMSVDKLRSVAETLLEITY